MSGREWQPGDVALIHTGNGFDAIGLRSGIPSNMGWAYTSSDLSGSPVKYGNCWTSDHDGAAVIRPLVVIDPEDREQVERFREIASRWADDVPYSDMAEPGDLDHMSAMQSALREFANPTPPKPEEPTGLGAVVEDDDGTKWLRHDSVAIHRRWLNTDDCDTRYRAWDEIAAVRVLSPGWSE